jgi:hypothetical protein
MQFVKYNLPRQCGAVLTATLNFRAQSGGGVGKMWRKRQNIQDVEIYV